MSVHGLRIDWLLSLPECARKAFLSRLTNEELSYLGTHWPFWSHRYQAPPEGDWSLWLFLGGRGAGKTKAGAEWVNRAAAQGEAVRIGIIGETMHDARAVMVEGKSGLLNPMLASMRPRFEASKRRLVWPGGAVGELFSADDPEQLRGPELDLIWADEFAKWRRPQDAFDMAQLTLRGGERPRMLVTTTPRNMAALKALVAAPGTVLTKAATGDNRGHLAGDFLARMTARYGGSRLGRQELMAEILEDDPNALFQRAWIDAGRVAVVPELVRVVVAVDPPVTGGSRADACGIVAAGRAGDGALYVLADRTVQGLSPAGWALAVRRAAESYEAAAIVVETNQGGELVRDLLRGAGADRVPVTAVRAVASKAARAAPVSVLYEQGRVHHVGSLPALEDEMCLFGGDMGGKSPDRVDALVWALTALAPGRESRVRVRAV
jgi:predicted phage terminase large subunit-like protein